MGLPNKAISKTIDKISGMFVPQRLQMQTCGMK